MIRLLDLHQSGLTMLARRIISFGNISLGL
jgi:hypothetical protein